MEKGNQVEDLLGLIDLAEKASFRMEKLKFRLYSFVFILLLSAAAILFLIFRLIVDYHSFVEKQGYIFLLISVSVAILLFGSFGFAKVNNQRINEIKVLDKLFDLIDPLKSQVRDKVSIIKMASIEIRLSRIDFGGNLKKADFSKPVITKAQKELSLER